MTEAELAEFKQRWNEYQRKYYPDREELAAERKKRHREYMREYFAANKEHINEQRREHYAARNSRGIGMAGA